MTTVQDRHPELFQPINYESPRGKERRVPMQVLCLGFNRTGTATMSAALEKLDIPCWHSFHLLTTHFGDNEMWQDAIDRKFFGKGTPFARNEFDQLIHSFGAVSSDTPAIAFADDLVAAYPEAKVVLVERDIEQWYESYMHAIIGNMFDPFTNIVYHLDRSYIHPIGKVQKSTVAGWAGIRSHKDAELKARQKYREHYALVRSITPKERLLEFKLEDGWEPLCKFLGKEVPTSEFPRLNEKAWLDEKASLLVKEGLKKVAIKVIPWVVAIVATRWAWSHYMA
ncbi:nad dependent epimerase [Ilyonectria robusta]